MRDAYIAPSSELASAHVFLYLLPHFLHPLHRLQMARPSICFPDADIKFDRRLSSAGSPYQIKHNDNLFQQGRQSVRASGLLARNVIRTPPE
jgi:hypothetical protein